MNKKSSDTRGNNDVDDVFDTAEIANTVVAGTGEREEMCLENGVEDEAEISGREDL